MACFSGWIVSLFSHAPSDEDTGWNAYFHGFRTILKVKCHVFGDVAWTPPGSKPHEMMLEACKKKLRAQNIHWNACSREKVPPRKLIHSAPQDRKFTTASCDRHARSYERVPRAPARSQFYHSFARSTRTILRRGCSVNSKLSILPQFRAIDTHDLTKELHFRKLFPTMALPPYH